MAALVAMRPPSRQPVLVSGKLYCRVDIGGNTVFSGIVEEIGRIVAATDETGGRKLKIGATAVLSDVRIGDSISCSGCCLTVTDFAADWFTVEATFETLRRTKLGQLRVGDGVNLERALRVSDRLGGHIVSGHVDGIATVTAIKNEGFSRVVEFALAKDCEPYFVEKGSVTVDGVSLTVAGLSNAGAGEFRFSVALIPHTMQITTLGNLRVGEKVNIEADIIGKYIVRLVAQGYAQNINKGGLSLELLQQHGYT
jgi:riboflavin synthase